MCPNSQGINKIIMGLCRPEKKTCSMVVVFCPKNLYGEMRTEKWEIGIAPRFPIPPSNKDSYPSPSPL